VRRQRRYPSDNGPVWRALPTDFPPDFARETAWQKITNRVEGTKLAAEKLGIS
jgi:hypothetical protein